MTGITDLTSISNGNGLRGLGQFGPYGESTFTWTIGTMTPSASNVTSGLQHDFGDGNFSVVGEGFSLTVPANVIPAVLSFYTTVHDGNGRLIATLADGSAPALTLNTTTFANNLAHTFSNQLSGQFRNNPEPQLHFNFSSFRLRKRCHSSCGHDLRSWSIARSWCGLRLRHEPSAASSHRFHTKLTLMLGV
jgi:hypothetical protein